MPEMPVLQVLPTSVQASDPRICALFSRFTLSSLIIQMSYSYLSGIGRRRHKEEGKARCQSQYA